MPTSKARPARIFRGTPAQLAFLAEQLRRGEVVAVPTETVYGLAGNALDPTACRRIFRAKGRPLRDPLIVHLYSIRQLTAVAEPNDAALALAKHFWPGPLTMVLPKTNAVPDIVSAGRPSVAVRMPRHPLFRRLLRLAGVPLAAPSANPFGYVSPTTAQHVRAGLGTKISYILDGGPSGIGVESTIIDLRDPRRPQLLRPGPITREALEAALGRGVAPARPRVHRGDTARGEIAPGMLSRHYSPRTPLLLHSAMPLPTDKNEAYVYLSRRRGLRGANIFCLDERGNLRGAARRLFAVLREIDSRKFRRVHVERAPDEGVGIAINDRLQRAAAR